MIFGVAKASALIASYGQMKTHLSQPTHFRLSQIAFREYFTTLTAFLSKPNCSRTFLPSCSLLALIFVPSLYRQNLSSHWIETMFCMPELRTLKTKSVGTRPEQGILSGM